jgi:23S rRNA (uracil1939-C5)-methyltransferase
VWGQAPSFYNEKTKKGTVLTIMARTGIQSGELQIVIITSTKDLPKKEQLIAEITKRLRRSNQSCKTSTGRRHL